MKIKNLLTTLALTTVFILIGKLSFSQTVIHSNDCSSATANWTFTNNSGQAIQQGGYWLLDDAAESIISETFDVTSYTNVYINYKVATYGSGTNHACKLEYSKDNGATWEATSYNSATPTSSTYIDAGTVDLGAVNTSQLKLKWTSPDGGSKGVRIDNISITAPDAIAPVATFNPINGATDVLINATPTISFNEAIRNTDDSEITDANVGSLVTLKEKISGNTVASTITIDATKKLITITPSSNLTNELEYEISLGVGEDANNNATTLTTSTFTTIGAATPTITLTSPNAGGKFYAGEEATITWTSTNIDAAETITIEVAPNGVDYQALATSTNDGTETITIPTDAQYATTYKIKVSYSTASDESDVAFTVIPVVANIAAFKALAPNTVAKISGEVIINFIRTANRNQKYVQDATGGLLIDDPTPVITTVHNQYDGITGLEGTLVMYGTYTYELVPTVNTAASTSTGNTITPAVITLAQLNADHMQYQSMLVKVQDVAIKIGRAHV